MTQELIQAAADVERLGIIGIFALMIFAVGGAYIWTLKRHLVTVEKNAETARAQVAIERTTASTEREKMMSLLSEERNNTDKARHDAAEALAAVRGMGNAVDGLSRQIEKALDDVVHRGRRD